SSCWCWRGCCRRCRCGGSSSRWCWRGCCRRRGCGCCRCGRCCRCRGRCSWCRRCHQLSVGEGILLGGAGDRNAPVHPGVQVLDEQRGAVIVVAHIGRLDAWVALQRQRASYIRERIVSQPRKTVVIGLARMHLVAGGTGAGRLTTGRYPRSLVVQGGEKVACLTDRKIRLPLGLGCVGIAVQLKWRAKSHATVG